MFKKSTILAAMIFFVFTGTLILQRCKQKESETVSLANSKNGFVGDKSCKSCHAKEYNDWLQSHHFMAMQPPNDSTVEGNFNNATFTADGVNSRFFKKDGKFFINTQGDDGNNHDYEVKYTFGFTPLQQYLVEFPGGRMQVPRVSWDTKQKKWFHQYPGQKISSKDWLHWTGNSQNWNTMCASCHSTNLQKNYDIEADSYNTTFSVLNVSCESCHGAGELHVDFVNSNDYKNGKKIPGSYLPLDKDSTQLAQINTCAPCHARKSDISASLIQSGEIMDNLIPEIPSTEHFHADGQANDEDYIYTSFLESKMFRRGVKCSNCHNPHSGKILFAANQLCLQCHAKTYDDPSHTFHPVGATASGCKSCHMPGKIYMGNDTRHDHIFRAPRPDLSVKYGTPNACNNCHNDKSAQWAADTITKWYGPLRKYHFAEDLIPGSKLDGNSEEHLIKILGDTSVPDIIKATAAHYLGSIPTQNSFQALLKCLADKDAQIRYRALRSLSNFPAANWRNNVGPLLSDKVRAVRIAAADLYTTFPAQQIPAQYSSTFSSARNELQNYLTYQADFSIGNVMIADHYLQQQDYDNAEKFYLRALKKDSLMNYARLNLSSGYNAQGKNDKALEVLETAMKIDPGNDRIHYNMALLYNEMNNKAAAERSFARAVQLKTQNPRVYYNYGLLLNELKKFKDAEMILQKGIALNPSSPEMYYALCFVYLQSNDKIKAKQMVIKLKELDPNNPEYQQLFKSFGI
ncbi:MAG TPA: tetratricopeptide repeat protein [Chitinophagaceae bacterium]|nr:tetratricopeptide repeat protein [Chitinophagaceae bacterium]